MKLKNSLTTLKNSLAALKNYFVLSKPVIAGFIGAAILMASYEVFQVSTPQIGSVNVRKLVNAHIEKRAKSTMSQKELEADSHAFVEKLERSFRNLAKRKGLYLIISDVVVTNVKDYTDVIQNSLDEKPR